MTIRVVGIGNSDRGDDAVGLLVVEALRADPPTGVELLTSRGDMLALLDQIDGADLVVLVDAVVSGAAAGTILRIDATDGAVKQQLSQFTSTHAFNLAEGIELARSLGRMPGRLVVYGIEGVEFGMGQPPGTAVRDAIDEVGNRIREECKCTKHP
ncbi:MAG: hydrogenase maturation protease [Planctomycetes bacterium]|nr:hydrogenase maturation protease [Planctomycetota bacterium]